MTGHHTFARQYPALRSAALGMLVVFALALGGCASIEQQKTIDASPASEPRPLRSARTGPAEALDLRADDLLMQAVGLIGTPYRFGGTTPQQGFDCSGFTSFVFREAVGVELPRTANDQFKQAGMPVSKQDLAAGDLVFFRQGRGRIDHVGIYVGEGRFVHSPSRGGRVRIDALAAPHWTRIFQGARRPLALSRSMP